MKLVATDGPHQVVTEDVGGNLSVAVTGLGGEAPFPMPGVQYIDDQYPSPMMAFPGDTLYEQGDATWDFTEAN